MLKTGQGGQPGPSTSCKCHYEGRLSTNYPSGKTFDSSIKRGAPATFAPNQVIGCWTEAMQMMPVGSKWELMCPPDIAYGSRAMGSDIPANSVLVFQMELLSCNGVADDITGAVLADKMEQVKEMREARYQGTTNQLPSASSMVMMFLFVAVVCFVFAGVKGKPKAAGHSRHGGG